MRLFGGALARLTGWRKGKDGNMAERQKRGGGAQRLDKLVASQTAYTRRQVQQLARTGGILVNGQAVGSAAEKADPAVDAILVEGRPLFYAAHVYYMLHKPAGVLSASRDPHRRTVVDLVEEKTGRQGLFPVGRLDKDTTGLLLITDDGDFAHKVISPKSGVDKVYEARLDGPVEAEIIRRFAAGLRLADGTPCLPARLRLLEPGPSPLAEITVQEGKYHQVKRMFGAVGLGVIHLHRVQIGGLKLDKALAAGDCRPLTGDEKAQVLGGEQSRTKIGE